MSDASGAPKQLTPAFSDYITGTAVAMGICAALYHRRETGLGQRVDGSLLKSALAVQDVYVMREPVTDAILREPMLDQLIVWTKAMEAVRSGQYSPVDAVA